jgi:hypothetical protein
MTFEKRPLSKEEVSPQVFKLTGPDAPIKMKKITAKGVAPGLGALDLVTALYQLHISGDQELSKTASRSMTELPDSVVEAAVESEDLHEMVLDLVAHTVVGRRKMVQKIILNKKVADESLLSIAPKMSEQEIEILARNERRLLSCPPIIEAIYLNRNTRMSTANRCIEFAARNKLELKLPAYKEMLKAIGMETAEEDPIDQALLEEEKNLKFKNALEGVGEADLEEDDDEKKSKGRIQIEHLSVSEKIRLAITGNVFHRSLLMRDSNKMVAMAAIKSPLVTEMEVVRLSKNPQTPEDALRYIARQREWIKLYQVKSNLVSNAKTPLDLALKLVSHLRPKELKSLSRSKNISAALRNAAVARLRKKKA